MKKLSIKLCTFCTLVLLVACSKNEKISYDCSLYYIGPPSLKFNIVNQSNGADLFFSENPLYQATDLKVFFKKAPDQLDSVVPRVLTRVDGKKYFSFNTPRKESDTCMIKIKNLQTDVLVYTIAYSEDPPCPLPYINSVKINNDKAVSIPSVNEIIIIEK